MGSALLVADTLEANAASQSGEMGSSLETHYPLSQDRAVLPPAKVASFHSPVLVSQQLDPGTRSSPHLVCPLVLAAEVPQIVLHAVLVDFHEDILLDAFHVGLLQKDAVGEELLDLLLLVEVLHIEKALQPDRPLLHHHVVQEPNRHPQGQLDQHLELLPHPVHPAASLKPSSVERP